mgnify:CR=1 FL=1
MTSVIRTTRDRDLLIHNNYMYHVHSHSRDGNKTCWHYGKRGICFNARCIANRDVRTRACVHSHIANRAEVWVRCTVANIKRRGQENPNKPPAAVIREKVCNIPEEETLMTLPE